jgi:hypothetical protein
MLKGLILTRSLALASKKLGLFFDCPSVKRFLEFHFQTKAKNKKKAARRLLFDF